MFHKYHDPLQIVCFSISPAGNQVVIVWPRPLSFSADIHWRTTRTFYSHQMWSSFANQKAALVYVSVGLAFVTTLRLFLHWLTRTQELLDTGSVSTSTDLFSAGITVPVQTRVGIQRTWHKEGTPRVRGLTEALQASLLGCPHPTKLTQLLFLLLGRTMNHQLLSKTLESLHSSGEMPQRWPPGIATVRWPHYVYSVTTPSSPPSENAYIFLRGW